MKKSIIRHIYIAVALTAAAMTASGCVERELSLRPSDGPLKVDFEWPEEAMSGGNSVEGAHLLLYGSDGTMFKHYECSPDGFEGRVPADTYILLLINSDFMNSDCAHDESSEDCCVYALQTEDSEGTLMQVYNVYCTGIGGVTVAPGNNPTEVTMYPENVVKHLTFDIDPNYVENISELHITMSGVIPSVRLLDGADAGDQTQSVSAEASPREDGTYAGSMSVFGWRGDNIVTAEIVYSDGREPQTSIGVDIGDQLEALPEEGGSVDIVLELPDGGEIDITIGVEPWKPGTGSGIVG